MRVRAAKLFATFFGCGYWLWGPGTAGSAAGLAIGIFLRSAFAMPWWGFLVLTAVFFLPSVWAAGVTAEVLQVEDPSCVVVDEVLGQWVTLAGAAAHNAYNWKSYLAAFALFRLFDIWKPQPVRKLESLRGGWGIVADDLMAGVYGALVLFVAGCFNLY